jgi:hypothetical protein
MTDMIRKQVYIHKRQKALLKRLSKLRGVSESEIIRSAIDREVSQPRPLAPASDRSAWEEVLRCVGERRALGITGKPYKFNRQELYEERENRWLRRGS